MNPQKLFCYALPAFYMAVLSLHGQVIFTIPVTIPMAQDSPVVVNTFPGAACQLQAQGDSGVSFRMNLYADEQGRVRFRVQAQAQSITPARLNLHCQSQGNQFTNFRIEISANVATLPKADPPSTQTGTVRPPLTGNPMEPSQADLLSRGYPMRPDPVKVPEAYATWLRMVTTPATMIQPTLVEQPSRFHAAAGPSPNPRPPVLPTTAVSSNWSGLVLYRDARQLDPVQLQPYDVVSAEWFVPAVTGEPDNYNDSALWTGMDGWGPDTPGVLNRNKFDVLQSGTEQEVFAFAVQGIQFTIANYYAWAEFFPSPEQLISNFSVSPGDHIVTQVLMELPNVGITVNGTTGVFYMQNLTTGNAVWVYLNPPPGTTFSGYSAEWIMERHDTKEDFLDPYTCCVDPGYLPDLANYSAATMFNAYAIREDSTVVNSSGNTNSLNVTMVSPHANGPVPIECCFGSAVILSEVVPLNNTSMVFRWTGFK